MCINERLYRLSLVQVGQSQRYRLHPLLHDFARERLDLSEDRGVVLDRLVDFYAGYVDRFRHDYDALERELDNILAAVEVARKERMVVAMIRTVTGLQVLLETKGLYDLAALHLEQAREVADSPGNNASLLATVLLYRSRLLRKQGEFTAARVTAEEGLELAQQIEDKHLTSAFLGEVGAASSCLEQAPEVSAYYREGLALARELGDPELMSTHLLYLGMSCRSDTREAERYYEEGLALARLIGDPT